MDAFTTLFRDILYKCNDISKAEALDKYIIGLNKDAYLYIEEHLPRTLDHAILLAKTQNSIRHPANYPQYTFKGRGGLNRGRGRNNSNRS